MAPEDLFDPRPTPGVYTLRVEVPTKGTRLDLDGLGGSLRWYGLAWTWWLRIALGWFLGERTRKHRPNAIVKGAQVDWWTVRDVSDAHIVLHTDRWFSGEAWLGYRIENGRLTQVGALRPNGLRGRIYWWTVYPIHLIVFRVMARTRANRSH